MNTLKKYQDEEFRKLLPSLKQILSQFELDEAEREFKYKDLDFIASKRNGCISFGLVSEKPIFPTLVYEDRLGGSATLLHYRIANDLVTKIKYLTEDA